MTYEVIVAHLKGFHLVLASHLPQRDAEGWKLSDKAWRNYVDHMNKDEGENDGHTIDPSPQERASHSPLKKPPATVAASAQLINDMYALHSFFNREEPPIISARSSQVQIVRYGFGDASGTGFGSTIQTKDGLKFRIGVWGSDDESESSNYKELENVVATIEAEAADGQLKDTVLFFFTDNSTVEAALHNGNSSSKRLFELVVRFRTVQLHQGTQVLVSHVSGKRMIEQGTDGVSRGNLKEGVGTGLDMLQFIPLHLSAIQRHEPLLGWLQSWIGNQLELLEPEGWFTRGHDWDGGRKDSQGFWRHNTRKGTFVWAPPPGAAQIALEQLRIALVKRQVSTHVVVCPRLLAMEWTKQLHKACDLVVSLPAGVDCIGWPIHMHEPLTIGFVFPFLSFQPWKRRGTPKMLHLARTLPGVWKAVTDNAEDQDRLTTAWAGRHQKIDDYEHARDGDHLFLPFECDLCIFAKLRGNQPDLTKPEDRLLMACIRRINLDAFWSRASGTVLSNKDKIKMGLKLSASVGLQGPYQHTSSLPYHDHCGYEVAIQMILASQRPGKHAKDHLQWDTIRKIRTAFSNQNKAAPQSNLVVSAFSDDKGFAQRLIDDKCASLWFGRFFAGCRRRMGQDVRPNKGMSTNLILQTLKRIAQRMDTAENEVTHLKWLTFGTYLVITYVLSLRGVEVLLLDLAGFLE